MRSSEQAAAPRAMPTWMSSHSAGLSGMPAASSSQLEPRLEVALRDDPPASSTAERATVAAAEGRVVSLLLGRCRPVSV